ncbi:MAG: hypothetical protein ABS62_09810 [Microbacterium sp. SCN 70-200]|uniref:type II toxin-antitoxin system Phd/YefM family antitoxin n=1 Tax=unclassified Microbacterium TaxID=2609290 RepID=UPI00086C825C|nr:MULTISPECIES: type II toxin-antitoxin system Phd/YefM family antitoxin [unclassified Microbacterium]MBN9213425.1 type II toxin-antitoxin system Phd/YefM family antitoxin [Microbacterium sp.]ODT40473.1 MAG: hypothetical protein ABS62_09810 [Microbacterium sp. SCN 70-200]OJV85058.1 MAG: hypothetical protein BGO46_10770 [Microbacterium sp. 70-16]
METVGIRKLKAQLSAYVDVARSGERVVITDRGKVVAAIVPIEADAVLQRLIDDGLAMPPRQSQPPTPHPRSTAGPLSDLVSRQRGE